MTKEDFIGAGPLHMVAYHRTLFTWLSVKVLSTNYQSKRLVWWQTMMKSLWKKYQILWDDAAVISEPCSGTAVRPHEAVKQDYRKRTQSADIVSDAVCGCSKGRFWVSSLWSVHSSETDSKYSHYDGDLWTGGWPTQRLATPACRPVKDNQKPAVEHRTSKPAW